MKPNMKEMKVIFLEAVERHSPDEWGSFLAEACHGNDELRRNVELLLEAHASGESLLDKGAIAAGRTIDQPTTEKLGSQIGPYKLLQEIGEGGFGAVYMAEQTEPVERRVALKIIKPGMDTREVIARFESERQALAMMDHPNVAKVFDAGATESGRPYFVMELVHGVPITEFCDNNNLATKQRLEMFVDVCRAVQHAHQKGIIHRDLKPNNIMVTLHDGRPVAKVIDFGVAKATSQKLTEKTLFTAYGQMIGTPTYMSPEQAEMSALGIDIRSDIYSLGVLLYEMLTGTTPLDPTRIRATAYAELQRIIREEVPPTPSRKLSTLGEKATIVAKHRRTDVGKLRQLLCGELDWIVMKALEKERDRRYESVSSFAADIERFLKDEAVLACPPSTAYRLRKFVRRNRGPVIAVAALLLMLCLGLAGTSLGLVRARDAEREAVTAGQTAERERDSASREANRARLAEQSALQAQEAERRLNFNMAFDRGLTLCDQGHVGRGMLWLARALELAPSEESDMRRVILANLNAWRRELHSLEAIFPHRGTVTSVAFSPDGKLIVTGGSERAARFWDVSTGRFTGKVLPHDGEVHEIAFSPDGSRVLTGNYDNTARLWDTETGTPLLEFRHPVLVAAAAFDPKGSWFVTGSNDGTVTIRDAVTGEPIGEPLSHTHRVHDLAISSDGSQIVTACHDGNARVWDVATRQLIATFDHGTRVTTVDFRRPECKQIVTGDFDGDAFLWDVAAAAADDDKKLEAKEDEFIGGPWRHRGGIHRLRVSRDGARILTASFDNTARLWDPDRDAEVAAAFAHRGGVLGVAFSPNSPLIVTASEDNAARLWRPAAGQSPEVVEHKGLVNHEAVFTSDGRYILIKNGPATALVRDTVSGAQIGPPFGQGGGVASVAVSPDESKILIGGATGAWLWDSTTGKSIDQPFHAAGIFATAFSPDGARMLTGAFDGSVQLREVCTRKVLDEWPLGARVYGGVFSPDGSRFVVTGGDKMVRVFDTNMGNISREVPGHQGRVLGAAFSVDGTLMVTGGQDNTVRVWDPATGHSVAEPMSHQSPIWGAVAFNADGQLVVTGCLDGTARIWDVTTAKPIGPALPHEAAVRMVAFSSDTGIRTGTTVGTVRLWKASTSPLEDDVERINLWVQVATGFELDSDGTLVVLDVETWQQRRNRLNEIGGPP